MYNWQPWLLDAAEHLSRDFLVRNSQDVSLEWNLRVFLFATCDCYRVDVVGRFYQLVYWWPAWKRWCVLAVHPGCCGYLCQRASPPTTASQDSECLLFQQLISNNRVSVGSRVNILCTPGSIDRSIWTQIGLCRLIGLSRNGHPHCRVFCGKNTIRRFESKIRNHHFVIRHMWTCLFVLLQYSRYC